MGVFIPLFDAWRVKEIENVRTNQLFTPQKRAENETCETVCSRSHRESHNFNISTNATNRTNRTLTEMCICFEEIVENEEYDNFFFFLIVAAVSGFTLLVNLILIFIRCSVNESSLAGVFGTALMFYNLLLSVYGGAMAVYLLRGPPEWHQQFCRGFTSIKLFALGASVWTMMMLTFHRSVHAGSVVEQDAIFKGIVFILEGLMLSGVFAVMSWIKQEEFDFLCVIFEPHNIVDWLLTGIEIFYYFMLFCLLLRYPYHQIRKKKRSGKNTKDSSHPIFAMLLFCFVTWGVAYVGTLPKYDFYSDRVRRVIRVVAIMAPLSLQAFIFTVRNTWFCLCQRPPCLKKEPQQPELLVCTCTTTETCTVCQEEYEALRFGNQLNYGNGKVKEEKEPVKTKEKKEKKVKTKKKEKKEKKKKKLTTALAIERSPTLKQKETSFNNTEEGVDDDENVAETPLLQKEKNTEEKEKGKKISGPTNDSTPLLDDTDGSQHATKATHDDTPVRSIGHTIDHPSFVHMDSAIDVDSLPKEKTPKTIEQLQLSNLSDERKSRGPTFFPLAERESEEICESGSHLKPAKKRKDSSDQEKKKAKKNKKNKNENGKVKSKNGEGVKKSKESDETKRTSIISLEWDHYSDSSGSISRSSDCFPDDLVIDGENNGESVNNKPSLEPKNNGILRNDDTKMNDDSAEENTKKCRVTKNNKSKTNCIAGVNGKLKPN